ncbi:MAG: GDP-L-fucose synthase [Selenomonas ruminantium]|uniref:GDP-L-fucose synthase n=1 Tax=Selenomonas ruminantium TaxID=971 RepID=A0A927WRZ4_SELRU|nr:GDP-L-fucose synthase [Selenomonas ruminantium]
MKILVTGANGLVGHSIVENKAMQQYELLTPSHSELDLLDYNAVVQYLRKVQPDCIIHAAGKVGGIAANCKAPMEFLLNNMDMGRNIIYGAFETGVKKFINLGSSCMYPRNSETPLTEDMVLKGELEPTNEGYALAKVMCARLCDYISRQHPEFQYKTLIPCNLYGRWDKFCTENAHMIPAVIHKLYMAQQNGLDTVEIWGTGKARREFMYSGDLADCIAYSIDHFEKLPTYLNVGLGHDYTVDEYYEAIAKVVGYTGKFTHNTEKPEGMKRKLTDVTNLNAFGWQSKISLAEGLQKTFEFYLQTER